MYELSDFKALVEKAKMNRDIKLLEEIHYSLLEWLQHLQQSHERNIRFRNYRLKSEIEELQELNLYIFSVHAYLEEYPLDSKQKPIKK
ncbi:MAG: hypothetical protein ACFE9S_20385 [Candidatus Hermodarchaeota archaeon]